MSATIAWTLVFVITGSIAGAVDANNRAAEAAVDAAAEAKLAKLNEAVAATEKAAEEAAATAARNAARDAANPACVVALDTATAAASEIERAAATFSNHLRSVVDAASEEFSTVGHLGWALEESFTRAASAYDGVAPLVVPEMAVAAESAASELRENSYLIGDFSTAAVRYGMVESNATTDELNSTAALAVDAPRDAKTAIEAVTGVFDRLTYGACL